MEDGPMPLPLAGGRDPPRLAPADTDALTATLPTSSALRFSRGQEGLGPPPPSTEAPAEGGGLLGGPHALTHLPRRTTEPVPDSWLCPLLLYSEPQLAHLEIENHNLSPELPHLSRQGL